MEAMNIYHWAQDKIDELTSPTKQDREKNACERRLKQMAARREKEAARALRKPKEEAAKCGIGGGSSN